MPLINAATFYKAIMDCSIDPIIVIDSTGLMIEANPAACDFLGYAIDELIGQHFSIIHAEDVSSVFTDKTLSRLFAKENEFVAHREMRVLNKSADKVVCQLSITRMDVEDGAFYIATLRSIEGLKKAEHKIKQMALVAQNTDNAIVIADAHGRIEWVNAGFERLTGYTLAEVVGHKPGDLLQGEGTDPAEKEKIGKALRDGKRVDATMLNYRKNGEQYWTSITIERITDDLGRDQFISVQKDITERIKNERLLRVSLERLNRSQQCANIGTWDWDIKTGELFWTELIGPLFGYPPGDLETSYENFLQAVHPDDRSLVVEAVDNCITRGLPYNIDHRIVWPDGSIKWVNEKGNVYRNKSGESIKMLGVVQDIQRAKDAENALIIARNSAEKANMAKSEFLSAMSHELRTPLNSVLGFSQLLLADPALNQDQKESVGLIYDAGEHLLNLVSDVLELVKLDSAAASMPMQDVDIDMIVDQCLALLSRQIDEKGIHVSVQCQGAHPMVRANELRLKQVLLNLLSNAVKYNRQQGEISISCRTTSQNCLRIRIIDTGYGIDPAHQKQLFTPFSRLGYENSSIEGVGIGLVISKRMIEAMNGAIGFVSHGDQGTEFWFEVRLSENGSRLTAEQSPIMYPEVMAAACAKLKILCIEDNSVNRLVLKKLCERNIHADFFEASTAQEGLRMALASRPDMVLLDLHLPDGHGVDVCQQLRRDFGPDLPIIAVTADAIFNPDASDKEVLFTDIELKPINVASMVEKIKKYCLTSVSTH